MRWIFRRNVTWFLFVLVTSALVVQVIIGLSRAGHKLSPREKVRLLMNGPLSYNDPELIREIRDNYLVHPSRTKYNLTEDIPTSLQSVENREYLLYKSHFTSYTFLNEVCEEVFRSRGGGFFVEAGALDGEFISNSLPLEKIHGWHGLLVEPDRKNFNQILARNRKAWSSPVCLSKNPYPYKALLQSQSSNAYYYMQLGLYNTMLDSELLPDNNIGFSTVQSVMCIPLQSLLLAINITHVDLLILDIEGMETKVMSHFPWNIITVDVVMVEHKQTKNKALPSRTIDLSFIKWVKQFGFHLYTLEDSNPDYVFFRKGVPYLEKAMHERPPLWNPEERIRNFTDLI